MYFSTRHRTSFGRGSRGHLRRPSAELTRAMVVTVDAANATFDDIARARAFERAMYDAQRLISELAAERQRAVLAARADGKTLDTLAVQLGTDRNGIQDIVAGRRPADGAQFQLSSPARLER